MNAFSMARSVLATRISKINHLFPRLVDYPTLFVFRRWTRGWSFFRIKSGLLFLVQQPLFSQSSLDAAEAGLSEEYIQDTIQAGAEMLPGQKYSVEKFLQSYLYCALRISEANPWRNTGNASQTWEDLTVWAKNPYEHWGDLYAAEAYADCYLNTMSVEVPYENIKGMFRPASWLMQLFTGEFMTDTYTTEERAFYYGYLPKDIKERLKTPVQSIAEFKKEEDQELDVLLDSLGDLSDEAAEDAKQTNY